MKKSKFTILILILLTLGLVGLGCFNGNGNGNVNLDNVGKVKNKECLVEEYGLRFNYQNDWGLCVKNNNGKYIININQEERDAIIALTVEKEDDKDTIFHYKYENEIPWEGPEPSKILFKMECSQAVCYGLIIGDVMYVFNWEIRDSLNSSDVKMEEVFLEIMKTVNQI